jgi:putative chitinase
MVENAIERVWGINLSSEQQSGVAHILAAWQKYGDGDNRKLAYILTTAMLESNLRPIKEIRARQGTSLWTTQNRYWYTGYYGRGYVQLTWRENYRKFGNKFGLDLLNNPDLMLQNKEVAANSLVWGMMTGQFTGAKLSRYINESKTDYYNARRVVNGTDKAQKYADYAAQLAAILGAKKLNASTKIQTKRSWLPYIGGGLLLVAVGVYFKNDIKKLINGLYRRT